jgi:uncharacterized Ntn-hydrolase superfamily protein
VSYGPKALALLRAGLSPAAIVKAVLDSDPDPRPADWSKEGRQFAVMDAKGHYAILAGEVVVNAMVKAFEKGQGHLSMRLMAALDAGQAAGGDKRGMQSAAMVIVKKNGRVWLNNDVVLRLLVDDSQEPLAELRRIVEKWNATQRRRR